MIKVEYTRAIKDYITEYDGISHEIWNAKVGPIVAVRKFIREHYLGQQRYRCAYCKIEKKESNGMTWDVEHILPKSLYPEYLFHPENLAVACKECNVPKDNHDILLGAKPVSFPRGIGRYSIVHPHFDNYDDHIEISVVGGKRIYRILNDKKGKQTYIICNLSRFDHQYAEWECFDDAIVGEFSDFLDRCPPEATPNQIKQMLGHLRFVEKLKP